MRLNRPLAAAIALAVCSPCAAMAAPASIIMAYAHIDRFDIKGEDGVEISSTPDGVCVDEVMECADAE